MSLVSPLLLSHNYYFFFSFLLTGYDMLLYSLISGCFLLRNVLHKNNLYPLCAHCYTFTYRINNDLLMWEPPPTPCPPPKISHSPQQQRRPEDDEFQLCKSAFRLGQLFNTQSRRSKGAQYAQTELEPLS